MGVDYTPVYGIGFEISKPIKDDDENTFITINGKVYEDMYELTKYIKDNTKFYIDEEGSAYDNYDDVYYIFHKDPFCNGLDLTKIKNDIENFCNEINLIIVDDFNIHGGIYVS